MVLAARYFDLVREMKDAAYNTEHRTRTCKVTAFISTIAVVISGKDIVSRIVRKVTPTPVRKILRPYWHAVVMMPTEIAFRRAKKDLLVFGSPLSH